MAHQLNGSDINTDTQRSWWKSSPKALGTALVGGLLGGAVGAPFAAIVTDWIKQLLAVVSRQGNLVLIIAPLIGIAGSVLILQVFGRGEATQQRDDSPDAPRVKFRPWRSFPLDLARADLTADVVTSAGREEQFPWRLAPIRAFAIVTSVGMGAPLGTESPAAHLGTAAGAAIGSRPWAKGLARSAGLAGGAAGVAVLMGLPLVGMVFVLELGRRRNVSVTLERIVAAGAGATMGWLINSAFHLDFIRLAVPRVPPTGLLQMAAVSLTIGAASGLVAGLTGIAIYAARGWKLSPSKKLLLGGSALGVIAMALMAIGGPSAAIGPGGGAVAWADTAAARGWTLLAIAILRGAATTAAVAAGGCGGVFVPFLAIGDLTGRAFVPLVGGSTDLAGAAGSAGGIAGGYRLPLTAVAMSIGVGGPFIATTTCVATAAIAAVTGFGVTSGLDRLTNKNSASSPPRPVEPADPGAQ